MAREVNRMLAFGSGRQLRRRLWARVALGVVLAASVAAAPPLSAAETGPGGSVPACDPEILILPAPTETTGAAVTDMNGAGLVVGVVFDWTVDLPPGVVVWDAVGPPTDLGIGGIRRADGSEVHGSPVDVNAAGVVAANRTGYSPRGGLRSRAALLWDQVNGISRLPAPKQRPKAVVNALNDHGVAVGWARGPGKHAVPVYWRQGTLTRLPLPRDARAGFAIDNNNRGLIIGVVVRDRQAWPWWWRRGAGNGPLSVQGLKSPPNVAAVDDAGRIVGQRPVGPGDGSRIFLWRRPSGQPRHILGHHGGVWTMDDARHLVGSYGGFRGLGDQAWVARLGDVAAATLPSPPLEDPDGWWSNTFGRAIARGVTVFAPQGGITVGGSAVTDDGTPSRAVLWTCAQAYRQ